MKCAKSPLFRPWAKIARTIGDCVRNAFPRSCIFFPPVPHTDVLLSQPRQLLSIMVESTTTPAQLSEAALGPESEKVQALHLEESSTSSPSTREQDAEKAHQILEEDEDEMSPEEEKAMLRKIDLALVPFASLLYL